MKLSAAIDEAMGAYGNAQFECGAYTGDDAAGFVKACLRVVETGRRLRELIARGFEGCADERALELRWLGVPDVECEKSHEESN